MCGHQPTTDTTLCKKGWGVYKAAVTKSTARHSEVNQGEVDHL